MQQDRGTHRASPSATVHPASPEPTSPVCVSLAVAQDQLSRVSLLPAHRLWRASPRLPLLLGMLLCMRLLWLLWRRRVLLLLQLLLLLLRSLTPLRLCPPLWLRRATLVSSALRRLVRPLATLPLCGSRARRSWRCRRRRSSGLGDAERHAAAQPLGLAAVG